MQAPPAASEGASVSSPCSAWICCNHHQACSSRDVAAKWKEKDLGKIPFFQSRPTSQTSEEIFGGKRDGKIGQNPLPQLLPQAFLLDPTLKSCLARFHSNSTRDFQVISVQESKRSSPDTSSELFILLLSAFIEVKSPSCILVTKPLHSESTALKGKKDHLIIQSVGSRLLNH